MCLAIGKLYTVVHHSSCLANRITKNSTLSRVEYTH